MVGPGEVDDDLEGETSEECSKYGVVNKCIIFEVSNNKEKVLNHTIITLLTIFFTDAWCI